MLFIPQTEQYGCGYACLRMMLCHLKKDKNYQFIKESKTPLSYKDMISIAAENGLYLEGFKVKSKKTILKNNNYPIIVSFSTNDNLVHSVIVKRRIFNRLKIYDPSKGVYLLSLKSFISKWNGTGLLIKNLDQSRCKRHFIDQLKGVDYFLSSLLKGLSGFFSLIGIFFINKELTIAFPIFFLSLFVLTELLSKLHLFHLMNKIDTGFQKNYEVKSDDYKCFFNNTERYKKLSITSPINLITSSLICIFLSYITIINNIWNIILVAVPLLLSMCFYFLRKPLFIKEKEIENMEERIQSFTSYDEYSNHCDEIRNKAYRYGKEIIGIRYINIFLMILSAFLVVQYTSEFALPQVVFFALIEVLLFDNFTKCLEYPKQKLELQSTKIQLSNIVHQKKK